jgi:site-specific DNA recombinase
MVIDTINNIREKADKMKVVIYVRVSTQEQAKEGYSVSEQTERLKKYAELMGWTVVEVFVDGGYSGGNIYRPALQDMISFIKTQNVDKVLVYKLDRLSRSQKDTLFLIEDIFLKNNTDFISLNENFDTATPFGRAMIGILAVFAQLEREQIKERMTMGREARAKEGYYTGSGMRMIGYDYIDSELIINEYEAMLVNEVFSMFINGTPIKTIEKILNNKGYNHKHGVWNDFTLRRMLSNRHYIGEVKFGGKWYQGKQTPIVSEEIFEKAQALLKYRKDNNQKYNNKHTSYLTGFMWCAQCGARYHRQCWKPKLDNTRTAIYSCYSRSKKLASMVVDPNCKNKNYPTEELENIVFSEILKLDNAPEHVDSIRNKNKNIQNQEKIALVKKEIKDLTNQISNLMDLYSVSGIMDDIDKKIKPLANKRTKLVNELEVLSLEEEAGLTNEEIFSIVEIFKKALKEQNLDEARTAISTLIKKIVIDEDVVTIHWNFS